MQNNPQATPNQTQIKPKLNPEQTQNNPKANAKQPPNQTQINPRNNPKNNPQKKPQNKPHCEQVKLRVFHPGPSNLCLGQSKITSLNGGGGGGGGEIIDVVMTVNMMELER
jgi:hypothetical protein